jgi:hypothetical protein
LAERCSSSAARRTGRPREGKRGGLRPKLCGHEADADEHREHGHQAYGSRARDVFARIGPDGAGAESERKLVRCGGNQDPDRDPSHLAQHRRLLGGRLRV